MAAEMERILVTLSLILVLESVSAVRTFVLFFLLMGTENYGQKGKQEGLDR